MLEKKPLVLLAGEGKRNHFEIHQITLFLIKPVHRKNQLTRGNLMRYYQSLTDLGEGKYPTPVLLSLPRGRTELPNSSHSSHPVPYKGGEENWETVVKFTAQSLLLKDWDLTVGLWNTSSPPTSYHHIVKGLLTVVPLTWYIMSAYQEKKKITWHTKQQKNTIWRDRTSIRNRHGRNVEIVSLGI